MNIKIVVEHDGKILSEVEREVEFDIVNDKWDKGTFVELLHPAIQHADNDDLVGKAVQDAEDYLNQNPELWSSMREVADYSGPDDPTGQDR